MVQSNEWNLTHARRMLSTATHREWQTGIESRLAKLEKSLTKQPVDDLFHRLMALDDQLNRVVCAITLHRLQTPGGAVVFDYEDWLNTACHTLARLAGLLAQSLPDRREPIPDVVRRWAQSLSTEQESADLGQAYRAWAAAREAGHIAPPAALIQRRHIDPDAHALDQRLSENNLTLNDIAFTEDHAKESRSYFDSLLSFNELDSATVAEIRELEADRYQIPRLTFDEALHHIRAAFVPAHIHCARVINALIEESRLRLLTDDVQPDLCLDTPFGSYVQVHFDGGLPSLVRLGHEIGHAIHQTLHRESSQYCLSLTDVNSETWALAFENRLMDALLESHSYLRKPVTFFQTCQRIEMNHRHRMLHAFERSLHHVDINSESDIDALWLECNRRFFGDKIRFDDGFESAWQDVHHFFSSPFYLMVYGVAKERADRMARLELSRKRI